MCFDKWVIKHETYYYALREIIIYGRVINSSPRVVRWYIKGEVTEGQMQILQEEIKSFHVPNFRANSIQLLFALQILR